MFVHAELWEQRTPAESRRATRACPSAPEKRRLVLLHTRCATSPLTPTSGSASSTARSKASRSCARYCRTSTSLTFRSSRPSPAQRSRRGSPCRPSGPPLGHHPTESARATGGFGNTEHRRLVGRGSCGRSESSSQLERASTSTSSFPAACAASVWNSAPAAAQSRPMASTGWRTPVSLFTHWIDTRPAGRSSARSTSASDTRPAESTPRRTTSTPVVSKCSHIFRIDECSTAEVTIRRRSTAP